MTLGEFWVALGKSEFTFRIITPTIHCQKEDQVMRERTDLPTDAEAKKRTSLPPLSVIIRVCSSSISNQSY